MARHENVLSTFFWEMERRAAGERQEGEVVTERTTEVLEQYELEVQSYTYGGQSDRRIAGINLYYRYRIPLLGVSQQRVTRGIAR